MDIGTARPRREFCRWAFAWLGATLFASGGWAETIRVSNPALQIGVDRASGQIVELVDRASNQNFAKHASRLGGLWELELTGGQVTNFSPRQAWRCQVETLAEAEPGLRLTWSGFKRREARNLRVEVSVRLDPIQALSRWTIAVEGCGDRSISRIRFPRVLDLPRLERERLVLPFWMGLLARNPRQTVSASRTNSVRREFDYPGHGSLQCLTFYSEGGPGLYAACDDAAGYRKLFAAFSKRPAHLNLEIVHLPERDGKSATRYVLPYSAILGTFHGDWYEAASVYRTWATNQVWARESRWKRGLVPSWIADTGLWVWNRGYSTNVLDPAVALQPAVGLPVSVFWHWWHGCAYDTGFPEYLPPREGNASFTAAVERAHTNQVRSLVYMNQRLWGMTTASWTNENAARYAVKAADGLVKPEVYNQFTKLPCASMCMGTEFWRAKYAGVALEALNHLGVDGIYMDQACSSLACFDPTHHHPLGGGTYWMDGFKTLAADIRQRAATPAGVALAGEGCAENWLPYLDLMLALDVSRERYSGPDGWEAIPFFHAVYHGYGVFYGNYSSLTMPPYDSLWPAESAPKEPLKLLDRKFSRQFCLEQARSFIWGQQPTIANFMPSHLRDRPEEIAYAVRLTRQRRLALKYLQDGAMLPPPLVASSTDEIPMSRLSIYAGQKDPLKEFLKNTPLVFASAWRALDGTIAVAVTSISDRALTPTILLDAAKCGLPAHGRVYPLGEAGAAPIGEFSGKVVVLKPDLGPRDVRVFELR